MIFAKTTFLNCVFLIYSLLEELFWTLEDEPSELAKTAKFVTGLLPALDRKLCGKESVLLRLWKSQKERRATMNRVVNKGRTVPCKCNEARLEFC